MTDLHSSDETQTEVDESLMGIERTPRMVLEICRGRTRFPHRPISGPRFFIGSGAGCDLRLGGDDFPPIHSVIQTLPNGIWFETLASDPPAGINGEAIHGEWLRDGDRIALGSFEFVAKIWDELPPASTLALFRTQGAAQDITQLSASQIADRLDVEMQEVEKFDKRLTAGAQTLLEVLKRRGHDSIPLPVETTTQSDASFAKSKSKTAQEPSDSNQHSFQVDLDHLCRDLAKLSEMLDRRSRNVHQREQQFIDAAEFLLAAQRDVAAQLESAIDAAIRLKQTESTNRSNIRYSA